LLLRNTLAGCNQEDCRIALTKLHLIKGWLFQEYMQACSRGRAKCCPENPCTAAEAPGRGAGTTDGLRKRIGDGKKCIGTPRQSPGTMPGKARNAPWSAWQGAWAPRTRNQGFAGTPQNRSGTDQNHPRTAPFKGFLYGAGAFSDKNR
jgi:hypothetical protein